MLFLGTSGPAYTYSTSLQNTHTRQITVVTATTCMTFIITLGEITEDAPITNLYSESESLRANLRPRARPKSGVGPKQRVVTR